MDFHYIEMEAANAGGYRWGDWLLESAHIRAEIIAHYMEKNTREGYRWEQAEKNREDPNKPQQLTQPDWAQFRQGGGAR